MSSPFIQISSRYPEVSLNDISGKFASGVEDFRNSLIDLCAKYRKDERMVLITLDGLSGSGKSTASHAIDDAVAEVNGAHKIELPTDAFITTERGSVERSQYLQTEDSFFAHLSDRQRICSILSALGFAGPKAVELPLGMTYNSQTGLLENGGFIQAPNGRKVVVMEGTDSTRIAEMVTKQAPVIHIPTFVHASAEDSLFNACKRDALKGIDFDERFQKRQKEMGHLLPPLTESLRRKAQLILDARGHAREYRKA